MAAKGVRTGIRGSRRQGLSRVPDGPERPAPEPTSASKLDANPLVNLSHELRTPLNGLVGSMELLSDTPLSSEQRELLELARASLLTVVNNVLDIAKLASGQVELEAGRLHDVGEEACDGVAEREPEPEPEPEPARPVPPGTPGGSSARILVAEDHAVNWMLVERLLARRGHRAVHAANGEQVLQRIQEEDFDLVLMDCHMPALDGYEATRRLRRRELGTGRHIPVVAMTANAMRGDRERCLAAGMDDYLSKPLTGEALQTMLARWLPDPPPPPVLDTDRLGQLWELFPGNEAAEALSQLRSEVEWELERLDDALLTGHSHQAAQAAHRIKGSAHIVGAWLLAEAAGRVQRAAEDNPVHIAREAVQLHDQWKLVDAALDLERKTAYAKIRAISTQ